MTDRLSIAARFWRARHRKGWMVSVTAPRTVHVLPLNDRIQHIESADCPCGPRVDCVENDDSADGEVVIHHSLDGREAGE